MNNYVYCFGVKANTGPENPQTPEACMSQINCNYLKEGRKKRAT
jgi:hypothetical protein